MRPGISRDLIVGTTQQLLDQFVCGLCSDVFVDPMVTQCCGQTYCKQCITQWLSDHKTCPKDNKLLKIYDLKSPPKIVMDVLNLSDQQFDKLLDQFICDICSAVFVQPVVTRCCGQTYCEHCITQWLNDHKNCHKEGKPLKTSDLMSAPKVVTNLLNSLDVKCVNHGKGCQFVVGMNRLDIHFEHWNCCQYSEEVSKFETTKYEPKVDDNTIGYEFGLKFKLIQVLKNGIKSDVPLIENKEENVFTALFDENDIDFEIRVENDLQFNVRFDLKIGNQSKTDFIVEKGIKASMKALENNGKHLHFESQSTDWEQKFRALNVLQNPSTNQSHGKDYQRMTFDVLIEKESEESEEEIKELEKLKEYENRKRMRLLIERKVEMARRMNIHIRPLNGNNMTLDVLPSDTIAMVKCQIFEKEGTSHESQILIFKGRKLENGITLYEYGIQNDSTIHMKTNIKGGGGLKRIIASSEENGQQFALYDQEFDASKKYLAKGFTMELRTKSKA